jgi:hypothetical protein
VSSAKVSRASGWLVRSPRANGSAAGLAALIPGAEVLDIPGRDHMLATGDKVFKAGVLGFLARRP